jgi:hypothetical protein
MREDEESRGIFADSGHSAQRTWWGAILLWLTGMRCLVGQVTGGECFWNKGLRCYVVETGMLVVGVNSVEEWKTGLRCDPLAWLVCGAFRCRFVHVMYEIVCAHSIFSFRFQFRQFSTREAGCGRMSKCQRVGCPPLCDHGIECAKTRREKSKHV